jgi:hypothetical protein
MPEDKVKKQELLRDIRGIILEIWAAHDRFKDRAVNKAEAEAFFTKALSMIENSAKRLRAGYADLNSKIVRIESKMKDLGLDK